MKANLLSSATPEVSPEIRGRLGTLLEHPAIWRGRSVAQLDTVRTGFTNLDEALPGHGWPRVGLIELLIPHVGVGELYLLLPALASLTQSALARWCAWISPPFEPFAPALAAHGVALEQIFVARAPSPLWAFEQALASGACDAVLGWMGKSLTRVGTSAGQGCLGQRRNANALRPLDIRRLQLAAEKGRALGVLFRPRQAAQESSGAVLRVEVEPTEQGARVNLLKSRGGRRGFIDLTWSAPGSREAVLQARGSV